MFVKFFDSAAFIVSILKHLYNTIFKFMPKIKGNILCLE